MLRIREVHLSNYKRFTALHIEEIPKEARLVVLVGPNGSGKSSVFDAFLLHSWGHTTNYGLTGDQGGYYLKGQPEQGPAPQSTAEVLAKLSVGFHSYEPRPEDWRSLFTIRTAYRNEEDFRITQVGRVSDSDGTRFRRIIDTDQAVSQNYDRLLAKRMSDVDRDVPDRSTFGKYRREFLRDLQDALNELFPNPALLLQDFGGVSDFGVFRFSKGQSMDFLYKNLSGGEKAAFDLLLDIFAKRNEFEEAVYCIDEPEAHIGVGLHGPLLDRMLELVPTGSQLWIATHSVGFVRGAYERMKESGDVVFLNFGGVDFDREVTLTPTVPNRSFWEETYEETLADLAGLVAPETVVLCEGDSGKGERGFDAWCYNHLFEEEFPTVKFVSVGGASEVERASQLAMLINAVARETEVRRVVDRDEMDELTRQERMAEGVRVLRRRELENYLYDPDVLETFLRDAGQGPGVIAAVRYRWEELLGKGDISTVDTKALSQKLLACVRAESNVPNLGKSRDGFVRSYLVPALKRTPHIYDELRKDVFG